MAISLRHMCRRHRRSCTRPTRWPQRITVLHFFDFDNSFTSFLFEKPNMCFPFIICQNKLFSNYKIAYAEMVNAYALTAVRNNQYRTNWKNKNPNYTSQGHASLNWRSPEQTSFIMFDTQPATKGQELPAKFFQSDLKTSSYNALVTAWSWVTGWTWGIASTASHPEWQDAPLEWW